MKKCHFCGAVADDCALFCQECGSELSDIPEAKLTAPSPSRRLKKRLSAFLRAYICTLFFKAFTYAAVIVTVAVCTAAGILLFGNADAVSDRFSSADGASVLTAVTYLLFIGVLIGIITLRRRPVKRELGFRHVPFISLPVAALCGYAGNLVYTVAVGLIPWPRWIVESHNETYGDIGSDGSNLMLTVVVTAVMTGIIEEIVFRGLVIPRLRREFSPAVTVIISGAFFGAAHPTVLSFCYAFILGILLGAVYLRFDSVLPCIVLHVFFNLAACIGYPESTTFFLIAVPLCAVIHVASGAILLKPNHPVNGNKNTIN